MRGPLRDVRWPRGPPGRPKIDVNVQPAEGRGGGYLAHGAPTTIVKGLSRAFSMPSRGYAVPARFA
jgi:hypothetical protein